MDALKPRTNTLDSLIHCLVHHAQSTPNKVFLRDRHDGDEKVVTWAEMAQNVDKAAARLIAHGLGPNDKVPLVADNGAAAMTAFLAVTRIGAIPTFMPFPNPKQDEAAFWHSHQPVFDRLGARVVITAHPMARVPDLPVIALTELLADSAVPAAPLPTLPKPDDPALLQHSSGTTSTKKGVVLSHRAILAQVRSYSRAIDFGPADVVTSWLPLYHDMGLITGFLAPLVIGAEIVSLSPFRWVARPAMLLDAIIEAGGTFCWLPNFAFLHLARTAPRDGAWDLSGMRAFISCSEPARAEAFQSFLDRFKPHGVKPEQFRVCYALAENVFAATQSGPSPQPLTLAGGDRAMDCGSAIDGVEIRIANPDGNGIGEILLRSPFLFTGYLGQPGLTAQRLAEGWYHTGDRGLFHQDRLYVTGRTDDRISVYGRNVHAYDVEAVVSRVPGIIPGRAVALGLFDPALETGEIVIVAEADDVHNGDLRRNIREAVMAEMGITVRRVLLVGRGWLIKTTSGKVSRADNLAKYRKEQHVGRNQDMG